MLKTKRITLRISNKMRTELELYGKLSDVCRKAFTYFLESKSGGKNEDNSSTIDTF